MPAYPEQRLERLGRWLRQHRTWTYAAAAALVGVSLAATIGVVVRRPGPTPRRSGSQGGRDQLQHGPAGRRRLSDERQRKHAAEATRFRSTSGPCAKSCSITHSGITRTLSISARRSAAPRAACQRLLPRRRNHPGNRLAQRRDRRHFARPGHSGNRWPPLSPEP